MCTGQEPELLEQINMATGVYEGVAAMRVREALVASARIARARSAAAAGRVAEPAAAEVIRLLDRASDLYAQVRSLLMKRAWIVKGFLLVQGPRLTLSKYLDSLAGMVPVWQQQQQRP